MAICTGRNRFALRIGAWSLFWLVLVSGAVAASGADATAKSAKSHRVAGAAGHWRLDPARSTLGFASVKNATVGEGHQFTRLTGGISNTGVARLGVDLASVDTGIEIRDQRMRELLFEVARFAKARVQTQVSLPEVLKLAPGQTLLMPLELQLAVHGGETTLGATVRVQRLSATRVLVSTVRPVVVNADALGLAEGIERLRIIAGLQTISPVVPVSLVLEFRLER